MGLFINAKHLAASSRQFSGAMPFRDISLAALLLFCALLFPFILSYHRNPIPSFYQEWLAIFLALAAAILVASKYRGERFDFPLAAWIPLALMPSVVTHLVFGNALIVHGAPLHLIYIGSAVLFMMLGRKLCSAGEAVPLADLMAAAFVTGALASSVASWHWRLHTGIFDTLPWDATGGWIAQRNQNALHIWLGVLGICHFALNRRLSWMLFLAGLAILTETAIHTESRSVYLYAGCGLVLGVWAAARSAPGDVRKRLLLVAILPVMFLGAIQETRLLLARDMGSEAKAVQRYVPATVIQDARVGLWRAAAQVTLAKPWIGAGPGSYIRESWVLSDSLPSTIATAIPATHAHNMFFQISAELGAPTALALAGLIGAWLVFALRQTDWRVNWLHVAIPLAILAHNQVEFTLWYLFFLIPAALSMGAATKRVAGKGIPTLAVLVAAVLGLGLAARLGDDYKTVEAVVANARSGRGEIGLLLTAAGHPVFGAWASTEIAGNAWPTGVTPQAQDEHSMRALFVSPLKKAVFLRYVEILKRDGNSAESAAEERVAQRVFGNE